ncbi:MAG: hypothetical protein ACYC91_14285 [Solirubrobacteraceae bacterium]
MLNQQRDALAALSAAPATQSDVVFGIDSAKVFDPAGFDDRHLDWNGIGHRSSDTGSVEAALRETVDLFRADTRDLIDEITARIEVDLDKVFDGDLPPGTLNDRPGSSTGAGGGSGTGSGSSGSCSITAGGNSVDTGSNGIAVDCKRPFDEVLIDVPGHTPGFDRSPSGAGAYGPPSGQSLACTPPGPTLPCTVSPAFGLAGGNAHIGVRYPKGDSAYQGATCRLTINVSVYYHGSQIAAQRPVPIRCF